MKKFRFLLLVLILSLISGSFSFGQKKDPVKEAKNVMMTASKFMVEKVSTNGGYVSTYLPDLSRRWGEIEAFKTMIWLEGNGTVSMGELFLEAYRATGDEFYYQSADKVAKALAWGQHPSGGWNYFIDFAGDASVREWYNTIGKNAWGFEEHNHYYGNATFDGRNTVRAAQFMLQMYLEKNDPQYKVTLDRVIDFVLKSQYPLGGWPQRYPLMYDFPHGELEDYSSYYTFNDDVISENITFLIQCYLTLQDNRMIDPIRRAMNFYLITQQGNPQAGWSKQHNMELEPAHARTYEPAAIYPDFTYVNARLLLRFYELTGEKKFIARVPDAISFLESVAMKNPDGTVKYPVFTEIGTNLPLYIHRKGSGVSDGKYWLDNIPENVVQHYNARSFDINVLKSEFKRLDALAPAEVLKSSPLKNNMLHTSGPLTHYLSDGNPAVVTATASDAEKVIKSLDNQGRWLVRNQSYSLPYEVFPDGRVSNTARRSDSIGRAIRDTTDQQYISVGEYLKNMRILMSYIKQH